MKWTWLCQLLTGLCVLKQKLTQWQTVFWAWERNGEVALEERKTEVGKEEWIQAAECRETRHCTVKGYQRHSVIPWIKPVYQLENRWQKIQQRKGKLPFMWQTGGLICKEDIQWSCKDSKYLWWSKLTSAFQVTINSDKVWKIETRKLTIRLVYFLYFFLSE